MLTEHHHLNGYPFKLGMVCSPGW